MGTIIKINPQKPKRKKIEEAVSVLKKGGLVIFPTDTVYALGGSIRFPKAINRIYWIKKRSRKKPLVFLIGFKKDVKKFTAKLSKGVKRLIRDYWPGSLTLVLPSTKKHKTVALRMPDHRIALGLIRGAGALAATSANLSGRKENISVKGMEKRLLQQADLCIDGGEAPLKSVSTVLDATSYPFKVLRKGTIKEEELK